MVDGGGGPIPAGERPNRGRGGAGKMEGKRDRLWGGSGARDGGGAAGFGRSGERRRALLVWARRVREEGERAQGREASRARERIRHAQSTRFASGCDTWWLPALCRSPVWASGRAQCSTGEEQ